MEAPKCPKDISRRSAVGALIAPALLAACSQCPPTLSREDVQHHIRTALDKVYAQGMIPCDAAVAEISSALEQAGFKRKPNEGLVRDDFTVRITVEPDPSRSGEGNLFVSTEDSNKELVSDKIVNCKLQ